MISPSTVYNILKWRGLNKLNCFFSLPKIKSGRILVTKEDKIFHLYLHQLSVVSLSKIVTIVIICWAFWMLIVVLFGWRYWSVNGHWK